MSEELKPVNCGCGGEAKVIHYRNGTRSAVSCTECDIETISYMTEAEAIEAWNHAMSKDQIEWLSEYATGLQTDPGLTAKVERSPNGKNGCCSFCGCELFDVFGAPEKYWKYCPQCGARLEWG